MSRLFWKIFLAFWLAMALLIGSLAWVNARIMSQIGLDHPEDIDRVVINRLALMQAAIERRGMRARSTLRGPRFDADARDRRMVYVLDSAGREIDDRPLPPLIRRALDPLPEHNSDIRMIEPGIYHVTSQNRDGEWFHLVAISPRAPSLLSLSRTGIVLRLILALMASAAVSLVLARSLTRPLARIRSAANALASGDLDARVGSLGKRRDELSELAADFDHMADQLKAALIRQQRLLRDVSHELRSPLTRIQVASELARQRLEPLLANIGSAESLMELEHIEADVQRLDRLIGDALQLARHDRSLQAQLDPVHQAPTAPFDLGELIARIVERARIESTHRGIELDVHLDKAIIVEASEALIDTAIENVLRNAIAYSPEHSRIDIVLSTTSEHALITIEDRGPGVPESQLDLIFDPFYRVCEAREHRSGGTGLGLSIAQRALHTQGGQIRASNRAGGGLSVRIQLPR